MWEDSDRSYGAHKVHAQLALDHVKTTVRLVAELMATNGLAGLSGRDKTTTTTRRDRLSKPFPDLVNRRFKPTTPNTVWYGDITYLWVTDRFWYLASVIDAATKEVLGWSLADQMRTELVTSALRRAIIRRGANITGVIFHSDAAPNTPQQTSRRSATNTTSSNPWAAPVSAGITPPPNRSGQP